MPRASSRFVFGTLAAVVLVSAAHAQSYPTRPVSVICALGAGTGVDITVSWRVLSAPANTPRPIANRLHEEMKAIMADPAVTKRVASLGLLPHAVAPIEEAQAYIKSEIDKWGGVIRKLGLAGSI